MPLYDYHCARCNKRQEAFRALDARDRGPACKKCGHTMRRIEFPKETPSESGRGRVSDPFRKV